MIVQRKGKVVTVLDYELTINNIAYLVTGLCNGFIVETFITK